MTRIQVERERERERHLQSKSIHVPTENDGILLVLIQEFYIFTNKICIKKDEENENNSQVFFLILSIAGDFPIHRRQGLNRNELSYEAKIIHVHLTLCLVLQVHLTFSRHKRSENTGEPLTMRGFRGRAAEKDEVIFELPKFATPL